MAAVTQPAGPVIKRKQSIVSQSSTNPPGVANVGAGAMGGGAGRRMSFHDVGLNMTRRMSVISMMRRMSKSQSMTKADQSRMPKLENTYKMKPDPEIEFKSAKIQKQMELELGKFLDGKKYTHEDSAHIACLVASAIKNEVKQMGFNRHRLVCQVIVSENKGQGFHVVSRPLWDDKQDSFAQATYRNGSIFAVALLHGVYAE